MARAFKYYAILVLLIVCVFPAIFFLSGSYEVANKTQPNDYSGRYHFFKSHDELELFARIHGNDLNKPYLLYLEDFPSSNNFIAELELNDSLKTVYNVIYLDYRGTGKSERFKNPFNYSINHFVYDIEDLRTSLSLDKLTILGHGMGGLFAEYYSVQFPANVEKLYLVSPVVSYDRSARQAAKGLTQFYEKNKNLAPEKSAYFEMEGYSRDDDIGFFGISKIMGHMDLHKQWYLDTLNYDKINFNRVIKSSVYSQEDVLYVHYQLVNIGLLYPEYKRDHSEVLRELKVPTKAIFGKHDTFAGGSMINYIDSINPNIEIVEVDSAKYFPQLENKNDFLKHIISNN